VHVQTGANAPLLDALRAGDLTWSQAMAIRS
jgi:hypothetical protein